MNKLISTFLLFFSLTFIVNAEEVVDKEWAYYGAGAVYSHADNALGFAAKFGFPMQKGFYLTTQATYLPQMLGYQYKEFRYEFYFELYPIRIRNFQVFAQAGFDYGMWMRGYTNQFQEKMDSYTKDQSLLFGGGICYNIKGMQIFADYKYYPSILSYHSTLGVKFKIFENRNMRNSYFRYLRKKMDVSPAEKL